jgi:hypothetical protein
LSGKYLPLADHLQSLVDHQGLLVMTIDGIGRIVGGLPGSAYKHREWWANGSHSQAAAWIAAGWRVTEVDLRGQRVTFAHTGSQNSVQASHRKTPATTAPPTTPWPLLDQVRVGVSFTWRDVGTLSLDEAGKPTFPALPRSPGLYRLMFVGGLLERARVYVGETDNLHRRLSSNYRNPGPSQQTSLRVNALLRSHIGAGGIVHLAAALEVRAVEPNGVETNLDLRRKSGRLLAENAALLTLLTSNDMDVENLG